jgi:N,N'-diacetyllegionaminate synthase
MSTLGEVKTALRALYRTGNRQVVMLHCTTSYPCPPADVNLAAMQTLMRELDCLVGYSDHTLGIQVPPMAVSLGAVVIEKHFTLSRDLPGPDHKASLNPEELKAMVRALRGPGPVAIPTEIMGSPEKRPTAREQEIMEVVRKSIVAAKDIPAGETVDQGMVGIKRPATGISPVHWDAILGKKTVKNIKKDSVIKWDDLENAT